MSIVDSALIDLLVTDKKHSDSLLCYFWIVRIIEVQIFLYK